MSRVIVIGGHGNFGARICRALARCARIEVIAAGRTARGDGARLDVTAPDFEAALRKLSPGIVVHCAGPFQNQDYRVARATIAAGAHYLDLADGRAFVTGFAETLHAAARAAGIVAISRASTVPALSSAVVDHLAPQFRELHEIRVVIAPGQQASPGAATVAAILSYAGRPFAWLRDGKWTTAWGWQELRVVRVGRAGTRLAAACDVPDLSLFPARYPSVRTVTFHAALELKAQHIGLWLAAALRRAGLPLPLERWARPLDALASRLESFGSDTGGMLVSLAGLRKDGRTRRVEWHLTAEAGHGPEIPCMPAILLARKLVAGEGPAPGAYPCMGFLTLADFEREFARWKISYVTHPHPGPPPDGEGS